MPFKNTYTTFDDVECGLVSIHDGFVLPLYLEKCEVNVEVVNHVGHYVVEQQYINLTDDAIEALYVFPISEGGTVHSFVAKSNDKVVESIVRAKDEESGTAEYDEDAVATADTRRNFLLSEYKPDLYQLVLGTLEPNSVTTVELKYVCELPMENNSVVLTIPTTIAPQYARPEEDGPERAASEQLVDIDKELEITVKFKVRQTCAFKTEASPVEMRWVEGDGCDEEGFFHSTSTLTVQRTEFEEEQTVMIGSVSGKPFGARILIEKSSEGEVAAMVTLVPDFPNVDFQAEMIFLVDRSGSMMGRSIEKAKEALHIFLASLPSDCLFNICSFNASFDFLFPQSVPYNNDNLQAARDYVDRMQAGGGTRVYEPLETIFKQQLADDCQKQIFVLTDGHVSRPSESIAMVKRQADQGRVFSLGIGEGASRELVNGLARSGHGSALFVTLAEDMKDKVMELLQCSILSALSDISYEWLSDMKPQKKFFSFLSSSTDSVGTVMKMAENSAPHPIPHVFSTRLSIVYQSLDPTNLPVGLKISGKGPEGDAVMVVSLDTTKIMQSDLLHKLMARKFVKMLEEDDDMQKDKNVQNRMIQLGTRYNVSNVYCAQTTTGTLGEAAPPATEAARRSSSPPSPQLFKSKKGKKSSGFSLKSGKSAPRMAGPPPPPVMSASKASYKSAPPPSANMQSIYQVSNTRQAKSKNMSYAGFAKKSACRPQSRSMSRGMTMMGSAPPMMQQSMPNYQNCPPQALSCAPQAQMGMAMNLSNSSGSESSGASPPPQISKSVLRDEVLMSFTRLQQTDGSFRYGDAFRKELKIPEEELSKGAAANGISVELFATLLVIYYLRSLVSNRKSSWSLMKQKADAYVAANIGDKDLNVLKPACEAFLESFVEKSRSKKLFQGWK